MKFGKYLASRQLELPEYSGHFIDYKALKKLIKQLAIPTNKSGGNSVSSVIAGNNGSSSISEIQQSLKENKATFFFRVERELDKVNSFYLEKQANLAINLNLLVLKRDELFAKSNAFLHQHSHDGTTANVDSAAYLNFRNSISFLNLYQNFKKIHQDLIRLQQFIELNETGFSKVVKKWDKRSKSHTKELFISTAVSVQPVFHKNEINELSDLVTQSLFDIESIMDGDYSCLVNYSAHNSVSVDSEASQRELAPTSTETPSSPSQNQTPPFIRQTSISISSNNNTEVDELYSSFVNVATIKDPDLSLLARWVEKLNGSPKRPNEPFDATVRYKASKIFLLSITNLKISDSFLESFLNLINFDIDFTFVNDDFNNNKTVFHECCSMPPASTHNESHVVINNGVKVINSNDSINHSRVFIVEYIMKTYSPQDVCNLLKRRDFNGRTCLHYAAQNNRSDLLDIIIAAFPSNHIDDLDNDSMSPLLLAVKHGHLNIIKKLVQFGSNPLPSTNKETLQYLPINYACKFGDYKILEYLLSNEKSSDLVKVLVNEQDVEGLLPLHVVAREGHYKLITLLIKYGAEVNKTDGFNKWTPIFYAAAEGHVKTTQELVKFGAKLDILDEDGFNVLYYCVVEGHVGVINELLSYHQNMNTQVDNHLNIESSNIMSIQGDPIRMSDNDDSEDSGSMDKNNVDSIPDLQLPPPILPLRRYGHNFLEQKVLIELIFPHDDSSFINLFNSITDLKPGRITLTSNISDIVPRNILLPLEDKNHHGGANNNNCVFQTDVDSLNEFRIDFEIFPKFGTRLIAKTTALSFSHIDTTSPEISSIELPLFDLRLRNIGQLKFNYQIIFPFSGTVLETTKFDTYWKSSTSIVKNKQTLKLNAAGGLSPNNFLSPNANVAVNASGLNQGPNARPAPVQQEYLPSSSSIVTATSLSGEYLRIRVCLLNDGTPVVCPHWSIAITENIDLYLPNLSLEQLSSITNDLFDYSKVINDLSNMTVKDISLIKKLLRIIYLPLDIVLEILSPEVNLNLELIFPSFYELEVLPFVGNIQKNLNSFIDFTLNDVFNHIKPFKSKENQPSRSIILLSSNSLICKILNWKQPNFPVFLIMNGITYNNSLKKFEQRSTNGLLINEETDRNRVSSKLESSPSSSTELNNYQELIIRSIKEAVNFTMNNNLFGLITSIHLLDLVPKLIPLIRSRGLILVASSDTNDQDDAEEDVLKRELDSYTKTEINGLRFDDVLSFKQDITM
ncbi:Pho81 protein [Candida orthopsilosis Co 90-125]|uniref:Pho81 protein n=1 Tax=Candida orthopsilosis (strain 90-125) TaxID=1136231 RepID=H8WWE5_CANO9|nr:Pho81 protein [Candida orthopsilosis Co 90-125]CCG20769.1 Pho81 protein [Candida orthopsilosis Co 90-125]